jgi:hypothetical protein
MPYYTRKGTSKKDKGKTCVYKKEDNTKVGCTAGPVEKYLAALHINESEENDLDWIKNTIPNPLELYYFKGFDDVGIIINSFEESKYIINILQSMSYEWASRRIGDNYNPFSPDEMVQDGGGIIWANKDKELQHSSLDYELVEGEIIIDNPFSSTSLSESKENNDLSWIGDIGKDIEGFIEKLSSLIKEHVPVAELELDWDTTSGGGEYFGKVWLYDTFYELYKYGKTFTVRFYRLDPETDEYYQFDSYEDLSQTRLLTILLNDMINVNKKNLSESEVNGELDWIKSTNPTLQEYIDSQTLTVGDKLWLRGNADNEEGDGEIYIDGVFTITGGLNKKYLNGIAFNTTDDIKKLLGIGIDQPHFLASDGNLEVYKIEKADKINESDDFGDFKWAQEIETDLVPGEVYDIKASNGYYWFPEKYIGRSWDNEHQIEFYKFKDINGGGSGRKSVPYVKELIKKGEIRLYDPNWSIKDELTFSDNLEDALKGNFVIYFKDGVYLDQTLPIQDKLFEMGFSFYTKGPNEYITDEDHSYKIQFFECFNWDTSNPRYKRMPSDQWDQKKILLSKIKDDDFKWSRKPDPRFEEQELFITAKDHNAIVINGDKYITNSVNESKEFDWIQNQEPEKELKKSKSYVIDVSQLRPAPMRHSHDPSLTKQDILRKLGDLGYDVEHIDVDAAKYFYVEPTDNGPSWQYNEYGTPIEFNYWVDYNTDLMDDPTYGGKYQMVDIDEFMFLVDNNLISESDEDMSWLTTSMGEPMTICDAELELNVGDNILINELPDWENVSTDGSGGKIHKNINATVLAVDDCDKIQPDNATTKKTILIHVNIDYYGFNSDWVDSFADEEHKQICSDGRCMFMICGDKYLSQNIKITKLNNSFLWESDENDLGWMTTTIPTRRDKIDFNKERFETTLDYGNDVNVGDKFIPPGGNIIWTVERKQTTTRGSSYLVTLKSEKNKLKFYNWNPDYGFPSYYRPWKKIIGLKKSITESKKPINEVAGISFESRVWTDIIYNEIITNSEEKTRLIIDGYDYPEAFDQFPIDYVVIDYYDRLTGYGQEHSGYDNDGNYVVLLYVQPKLVQGQGSYSLKSALNHEMRHAWEDYNRISRGKPNIEQTKESKELYNRDFIQLMSNHDVVGPVKDILKYYYYLSNLETGPYLENTFDGNSAYENMVRQIATKDFESFKERYDLDINWHLINTAYNIPFVKKFKSVRDFIDYSAKELRKRANKIIKKINKMKYVHGKV